MQKKLILCSSITYALKGRNALSRKGYKAYITRTPKNERDSGCGYCLSIDPKDFESASEILKEHCVKIRRIFDVEENGGESDGVS